MKPLAVSRSLIAGLILAVTVACTIAQVQRQPTPWLEPDFGLELAWVSVVDPKGNSFPGLKWDSFHVWEDNVEQKLVYFAPNNEPISVGIIPCGGIECAKVPLTFLKATSWAEEYFVVVENGRTPGGGFVLQSFTTELHDLPEITPSGHAAGVVSMGLDYLKESANHRKVLLLIGTGLGMPNSGGASWEYVLKRAIRQENVQIYSIVNSRFDEIETLEHERKNPKKQPDPLYAQYRVPALSRATGGRAYYSMRFAADLEDVAAEIARGLETQYLIGYKSSNPSTDGKWREIRVEVHPPAGAPELAVWTKTGYWADKEKTSGAPNPK